MKSYKFFLAWKESEDSFLEDSRELEFPDGVSLEDATILAFSKIFEEVNERPIPVSDSKEPGLCWAIVDNNSYPIFIAIGDQALSKIKELIEKNS